MKKASPAIAIGCIHISTGIQKQANTCQAVAYDGGEESGLSGGGEVWIRVGLKQIRDHLGLAIVAGIIEWPAPAAGNVIHVRTGSQQQFEHRKILRERGRVNESIVVAVPLMHIGSMSQKQGCGIHMIPADRIVEGGVVEIISSIQWKPVCKQPLDHVAVIVCGSQMQRRGSTVASGM